MKYVCKNVLFRNERIITNKTKQNKTEETLPTFTDKAYRYNYRCCKYICQITPHPPETPCLSLNSWVQPQPRLQVVAMVVVEEGSSSGGGGGDSGGGREEGRCCLEEEEEQEEAVSRAWAGGVAAGASYSAPSTCGVYHTVIL